VILHYVFIFILYIMSSCLLIFAKTLLKTQNQLKLNLKTLRLCDRIISAEGTPLQVYYLLSSQRANEMEVFKC
jgi:hypothetical protein